MVASVHLATSLAALARFKCLEPAPAKNLVFRRTQSAAENTATQASPPDGTETQQAAWTMFTGNAKRALQSWQRMAPGGHPIQPPYFTGVRGAPEVRSPIWTGRKDANGSIHIHSLSFPPIAPHLTIAPGRTPLHPMVMTLDGRTLGADSPLQSLEMANLLAETLDHAV
jgi:hypothetical protein